MTAFYNENDPCAAAWLLELIREGHIAPGVVDERDIRDLNGDDLADFTQVHFFAGIGGWSRALRLAGWADDQPVWTGSCPCQPFSDAGDQRGEADHRHLWPEMRRPVEICRPPIIFGEQVASKLGRQWLSRVRADLEELGYGVGAADLCAAGVGSPHVRQRLFWLADSGGLGRGSRRGERRDEEGEGVGRDQSWASGEAGRLGNASGGGCGIGGDEAWSGSGGHTLRAGWSRFDVRRCRDGKSRRIESGLEPLADGIPGRVELLRGYGNAIVPQVAAAFIAAYLEAREAVPSCA